MIELKLVTTINGPNGTYFKIYDDFTVETQCIKYWNFKNKKIYWMYITHYLWSLSKYGNKQEKEFYNNIHDKLTTYSIFFPHNEINMNINTIHYYLSKHSRDCLGQIVWRDDVLWKYYLNGAKV